MLHVAYWTVAISRVEFFFGRVAGSLITHVFSMFAIASWKSLVISSGSLLSLKNVCSCVGPIVPSSERGIWLKYCVQFVVIPVVWSPSGRVAVCIAHFCQFASVQFAGLICLIDTKMNG